MAPRNMATDPSRNPKRYCTKVPERLLCGTVTPLCENPMGEACAELRKQLIKFRDKFGKQRLFGLRRIFSCCDLFAPSSLSLIMDGIEPPSARAYPRLNAYASSVSSLANLGPEMVDRLIDVSDISWRKYNRPRVLGELIENGEIRPFIRGLEIAKDTEERKKDSREQRKLELGLANVCALTLVEMAGPEPAMGELISAVPDIPSIKVHSSLELKLLPRELWAMAFRFPHGELLAQLTELANQYTYNKRGTMPKSESLPREYRALGIELEFCGALSDYWQGKISEAQLREKASWTATIMELSGEKANVRWQKTERTQTFWNDNMAEKVSGKESKRAMTIIKMAIIVKNTIERIKKEVPGIGE